MKRPNILLIYCDQMRHDLPGYAGRDWALTPNLDRLAADGICATQASTVSPVCMPARWSLLSGTYPHRHRCHSNHHPGDRPGDDLYGCLRAGGYRTGLVGKNHSFVSKNDVDVFVDNPIAQNPACRHRRQAWAAEEVNRRLGRTAAPGGVAGDADHDRTTAALDFLAADDERPWFLWLSYLHPHTPYHAPEPFFSAAAERIPPAPVRADGRFAHKPFRQQFHRLNNDALLPFDEDDTCRMRQVYAAQAACVDAEIGRVLAALEQAGSLDDTLIVFTSDHGDYMGDQGRFTKSPSCAESLVRVPLLLRWPGQLPAGHRDARLIEQVDLMPTVLAAAGLPVPARCQGLNLLPFFSADGLFQEIRPAAVAEYGLPGVPASTPSTLVEEGIAPGALAAKPGIPWEGNPISLAGRIRMWREARWKYVSDSGGPGELYDLAEDPDELDNRIDDPACAAERARLERALEHWLGAQNAPD